MRAERGQTSATHSLFGLQLFALTEVILCLLHLCRNYTTIIMLSLPVSMQVLWELCACASSLSKTLGICVHSGKVLPVSTFWALISALSFVSVYMLCYFSVFFKSRAATID